MDFHILNDHAVLVGGIGNALQVEIPAVVDDVPVTTIGERAFYESKVERVLLPRSITCIEDRAFLHSRLKWIGCGSDKEDIGNSISCIMANQIGGHAFEGTYLEDVILCADRKGITLGQECFSHTTKLRTVLFAGDLGSVELQPGCFRKSSVGICLLPVRYGVLDTIPEECFMGCNQLRGIRFHAKRIGAHAFLGCKSLRGIVLPEGVEAIADGAFSLCSNIERLSIPGSCCSISPGAFENCGIRSFEVSPENPFYCCEDGVVFDKEKTSLIAFPPARDGCYTIPEGIAKIVEKAFFCSSLSHVVFPSSLQRIEEEAFDGAHLLEVDFPDSLQSIGECAFSHCHRLDSVSLPANTTLDWEGSFYGINLIEIVYRGTREQYEKSVTGELVNTHVVFYFLDEYGREYKAPLQTRRTLEFAYTVFPDGIRIEKVLSPLKCIVLPEMIEDTYVTEISLGAIPANAEDVYIPNSVRDAPEAFAGAHFLKKITIPLNLWIEPLTIPEECEVVRY